MLLRRLLSHASIRGLLALATACSGGSDEAPASGLPPEEAAPGPDRAPSPAPAAPAETATPAAAPSRAEQHEARLAHYLAAVQSVDDVLERHCGACHGKSVPTAPCGLRFDTFDDLYALSLLRPLSSEASLSVQVIVDGSMPPPGVQPRPSAAELDALRAFIDDPVFWSALPPDGRTFRQARADAERNACPAAPEGDAGESDAGAVDAG